MSLWKLLTAAYDSSANNAKVRIDAATSSLQTVPYEHHEIHGGSSFTVYFDNTTANNDDDVSCIGFSTPNTTKWFHMIVEVSSSDPSELFIEEGVTIDDDAGTQATAYDRNRNTGNTSTILSLEGTPTAGQVTTFTEAQFNAANYSAGTILDRVQLIGGTGPRAVGGEARGQQEWVLKQNTKYLIRLQNVGANANVHEIHLDWYEHTDHN